VRGKGKKGEANSLSAEKGKKGKEYPFYSILPEKGVTIGKEKRGGSVTISLHKKKRREEGGKGGELTQKGGLSPIAPGGGKRLLKNRHSRLLQRKGERWGMLTFFAREKKSCNTNHVPYRRGKRKVGGIRKGNSFRRRICD